MSSCFNKENIDKSVYDWDKKIGKDWSRALSELLESEYCKNLVNFIDQIYLSNKEIYPIKSRLFKPFLQCSLKDVKIVIIDDFPVRDIRSSGLGRGIECTSSLVKDIPIELREFRDCIYETIFGNQYSITNFDNSLEEYTDNDILFLNASMCVEKDKDYTVVWKNFIRNVIQEINSHNVNVVYLFLTDNNNDLYQFIDQKSNVIIINDEPTLESDSTVFLETDKYIEKYYPQYNRIVW